MAILMFLVSCGPSQQKAPQNEALDSESTRLISYTLLAITEFAEKRSHQDEYQSPFKENLDIQDLVNQLDRLISQTRCQIRLPKTQKKDLMTIRQRVFAIRPTPQNYEFSVEGERCPVQILFSIKFNEKGSDFFADIDLQFRALSEQAQKALSVVELNLQGQYLGNWETEEELKYTLKLEGQGNQLKFGRFRLKGNVHGRIGEPQKETETEEWFVFSFGDREIKLNSKSHRGENSAAYFIVNNLTVSSDSYRNYFMGIRLPGIQSWPLPAESPDPFPRICEASVFDLRKISFAEIKRAREQGRAVAVSPEIQLQSCERDLKIRKGRDNKTFFLGLEFSPEGATARLAHEVKRGLFNTVIVSFDPEKDSFQLAKTNDYALDLICKPVTTCL